MILKSSWTVAATTKIHGGLDVITPKLAELAPTSYSRTGYTCSVCTHCFVTLFYMFYKKKKPVCDGCDSRQIRARRQICFVMLKTLLQVFDPHSLHWARVAFMHPSRPADRLLKGNQKNAWKSGGVSGNHPWGTQPNNPSALSRVVGISYGVY